MTDKTDPTDKTEDDSVSYDILEDNCIGIKKNIPREAVIGVTVAWK